SSSMAVSIARPLSVSVYAPLSRLCAMKPRMAMDCIAWSVMPTELWWMPVATQNKITRSCALSFVVGFSIIYSTSKQRQPQHAASDSSPAARSIRPSAEHFQQWAALASAGCIRGMARGSGRYSVPSAHENWSLVHKGVVVDLVNHEIRHVGARDEPAPP